MSPLSSRVLRGQAPRRRYAVATQAVVHPARTIKARRCAQDVEWQGQPGLEPGRSLAGAAGLLACASKHNGLLHEVWPVVRCALLVSTPLRLSPCALAGSRNPRYVLRPSVPARGTSLQLVPRPIPKRVLAMASPSPQGITARRFAQS